MTDSVRQDQQITISDLIFHIMSLEKRVANLELKLEINPTKNERPENPDDYLERKSNTLFSSFCKKFCSPQ